MNTPAHLIFASAAFARTDDRRSIWAALAGGLAPDLSLYLMAGICLFVLGMPPQKVFDELYFSEAWQQVFAIDNSFFVWGALLGLALLMRFPLLVIFSASALLHIAFDFPLHHDDGRAHFWPLSRWVFESPISYWDPRHHGGIVSLVEMALVAAAAIYLWRKFRDHWERWIFAVLALLQISPWLIFTLMFS